MLPNTMDTSGSFFIRLDLSAAFNIVNCSHFLTILSSLGFCDIILLGFPVLWHLLSVLCLILHLHLTSKCCCCLGLALYSFVSLIFSLSYLISSHCLKHMKYIWNMSMKPKSLSPTPTFPLSPRHPCQLHTLSTVGHYVNTSNLTCLKSTCSQFFLFNI